MSLMCKRKRVLLQSCLLFITLKTFKMQSTKFILTQLASHHFIWCLESIYVALLTDLDNLWTSQTIILMVCLHLAGFLIVCTDFILVKIAPFPFVMLLISGIFVAYFFHRYNRKITLWSVPALPRGFKKTFLLCLSLFYFSLSR